MDREERLERYGSILYCPKGDTLCMGVNYNGDGSCKHESCCLEDPEYIKRQEEIRKTYQANHKKYLEKRNKNEEKPVIRRQTQPEDKRLIVEIGRKKEQMHRQYTKGRTRVGDQISRELAQLERRLEDITK